MSLKSAISQVPTGQILSKLVHPSVFALIEMPTPLPDPVVSGKEGYTVSTYETKTGKVLVSNDGIRVLIEAWYKADKILMCAIRDRQLDGTDGTSPLTFFPNTDPACNRLPGPGFKACELSIYSMDPATYLDGLNILGSLGNFIADPDYYVWKSFDPKLFFPLWSHAFHIGRGPWQSARPMKGVPAFFVTRAIKLLTELGYHRVDAVPSWFNVARFFEKLGFTFTYGEQELTYRALLAGLNEFSSKAESRALTSPQESWLVALQNIPDSYIPDELRLPARWPVTHTNSYWVRMHRELNEYTPAATEETAQDPLKSTLLSGIRQLRNDKCDDKVQLTLHTRRKCNCSESLGASSPGATSPAATTTHSAQETPAG
ncbi:MAG: GNAT family N-acetyltransferase [Cyanobacteria bacterium]|nr:GNAT family N-acetyltransferase [Cyanobacteriota bacterium]